MKNSILPLERRVLILSLSLSLLASVASAKQIFTPGNPDVIPSSEKVMDELYAVHPYGVPGAMTAFPDGSYAYVAEGGSVALLWSDPALPLAPNNYKTPLWRKPLGSLGVYPMEMVLDPDMDFTEPALNSADPNALLYIAGGRDGLWVMNANVVPPTSGPIAFRIDDSGDSNPATQFGRKLCNDVKIMEVGGNKYVVAIFGATAHSILRVYTMQQVQGVVLSGLETGAEVAAYRNVLIRQNPNVSAGNPNSRAFSFGLAIDENEGPVDSEEDGADVYIAMGEHGIYRVSFLLDSSGHLTYSAPQGPSFPIEYGPWFGAGSAYEQSTHDPDLYGTVDYYDLENNASHTLTYQHCPYFLDVAVEDRGPGHHRLYAAVDHLGWVAFNLDAPWDEDIYTTGSNGYPDFIQEGVAYTISGQLKKRIRLIEEGEVGSVPENERQTYSRHLDVVETRDSVGANPTSALVVSVSSRAFLIDPGRMNDGRNLTWDIMVGPIRFANYPPASHGAYRYILAYDLTNVGDSTASPAWLFNRQNYIGWSLGGWDLYVPEVQPDGELHYFYGENVPQKKTDELTFGIVSERNLSRVWHSPWPPVTPPTKHTGFLTRDRFHRLGRFAINFGPSLLDERILVTAGNDGGIVPDGPLVIDPASGQISAPFATEGSATEPAPITAPPGFAIPAGQARDLSYGVLMDPRGGFVAPLVDPTHEYRMGFGERYIGVDGVDHLLPYAWQLGKFSRGLTGGAVTSVTEKRIFITPPANKFSVAPYSSEPIADQVSWSGRPYYSLSTTFEEYNAYVAANFALTVDPMGLMFSTVHGSPQGLWALGLSQVQALADDPSATQDFHVKPDNFHSNVVGTLGKDMIVGGLVTHPEYWNIEDVRTTAQPHVNAEYFIQRSTGHKLSSVQEFSPDMFQLPDPENEGELKWVLAVPCGYVAMPLSEPQLGTGLGWEPDAPEFTTAGFHHMMVRVFDMSDPTKLDYVNPLPSALNPPNNDSPTLPAFTLIGPDQYSSAFTVKGLQVQDPAGKERYFMLVGDLGGRVYLYDVENLLDPLATQAPHHPTKAHFGRFFTDAPLLTYQTQVSKSDDEPNGVFGIEVVPEQVESVTTTYVYLAVWRVGVEVLKLGFDCAGPVCTPTLSYLGHIQTPGTTAGIFVKEFPAGSGFPSKLLYVADYDAGLRVYKHP